MLEKFFAVDAKIGQKLINTAKTMTAVKRGFDRRAHLIGDFAVLSTSRLTLRNADTRDDDLRCFDEIIQTLADLNARGVNVVPILGYQCDESGAGYVIQRRAKGEEMYDDALLSYFECWANGDPENTYLSNAAAKAADKPSYIVKRTHEIASVPQKHYDKLISDMIAVLERDILIDAGGKSNFFYDGDIGFQLIDLDSHIDFRYGLESARPDARDVVSRIGFAPCHFAEGTRAFAPGALDEAAIGKIGDGRLRSLKDDNAVVFEKCLNAMRSSGIPDAYIDRALQAVRIYCIRGGSPA